MDPLALVLIVAALTCAGCWIASLVTKDTSWVDRIWSIVPAVYVWIFAIAGIVDGNDAARLILMALLVTAWAARLTFNFARKGGYTGMEDYRWAILRGRMKPWQFQIFNLLFIVLYQNALLVLITLPAFIAWQNPAPLNGWDAAFAILFAGFLVGEFVADQQQWDFHKAKAAAGGHLEPGFVTTGLFRVSRHPNFFFEQAQWWAFYADRGHGGRGIRPGAVGRRAQLDDHRRGAAELAVHRVDDLHRVDHGVEVPRLRRIPEGDVDARPAATAPRRGRPEARLRVTRQTVAYPSGFLDCQFQ